MGYCPLLAVLEPRPARQAQARQSLAAALAAISPLVEETAPGLLYADLGGLQRLYPAVADLDRAIRDHTPAELHPRLGIAARKFTASVAAQAAGADGTQAVAAQDSATFLAPQPIDWLPLEEEMRSRLRLLGLETLGALAALPRHAVEAQFGLIGGWAWQAANGLDPSPIIPRRAEEGISEALEAQPPLVSREAVEHGAKQLLARALRHPAAQGRFVRALQLHAITENERVWTHRHVLKEPSSDRSRLWTVIRAVLETASYPGPIATLSLELLGLTVESGIQASLFPGQIRHRERLGVMVRQLKARYRESPVKQLVEVAPCSRIPERRYALMDYDP